MQKSFFFIPRYPSLLEHLTKSWGDELQQVANRFIEHIDHKSQNWPLNFERP